MLLNFEYKILDVNLALRENFSNIISIFASKNISVYYWIVVTDNQYTSKKSNCFYTFKNNDLRWYKF